MEQTSSKHSLITTKQLTLIGVMTAVICLLAPFAIPIPFSPIPITLATLVLYITAFVLGPKLGTISCFDLSAPRCSRPACFSGFSGGFAKIAGPTGGYMLGYLFLTLTVGFFVEHFSGRPLFYALGLILGTALCYLFGTIWLGVQMNLSLMQALAAGVIPYLPGDIIKIIIACLFGPKFAGRQSSAWETK